MREGRRLLIVVGIIATLLAASLVIAPPLMLQLAELRLYDTMLETRRTAPHPNPPVLVGIDDQSLFEYGQWPWPRYRLARVVERLHSEGAKVIALDLLMPEPDRSSPEVLQRERERDLVGPQQMSESLDSDSNSQRLAIAIADANVVLGYYMNFPASAPEVARSARLPASPRGLSISVTNVRVQDWPQSSGMIGSIPAIAGAAGAEGFANAVHDVDGVVRRAPLLLPYRGTLQPSLALAAVLLSSTDRAVRLIGDGESALLNWGNRTVELDRKGNFLLDFHDPAQPFPYLSVRDVLDDKPLAIDIRDRIVLVGASAKGLGDLQLTPSGRTLNGIEIQATMIDGIVAGTFITRPGWARGVEFTVILLLGLCATLLLSGSRSPLVLLALAIAVVGAYWASRTLLAHTGMWISPLPTMVVVVVVTFLLTVLKYGIESRKVSQRTQDLIEAQNTIILSMSALAEIRDQDTGAHILRTQRYVEILGRHLRSTPKYAYLDDSTIELLKRSAPLHDIGKVGIPDHILQKPGKLTDAEFEVMKTHPLIGAKAISRIIDRSAHPENNEFLDHAREMIISHHERWDGTGYPYGLERDAIPLAGRLMALADVYDALITRRIYKEAYAREKVQEIILAESGTRFDPDIVAAFVATSPEFYAVSCEFPDELLAHTLASSAA